jgi:hypothetical protein
VPLSCTSCTQGGKLLSHWSAAFFKARIITMFSRRKPPVGRVPGFREDVPPPLSSDSSSDGAHARGAASGGCSLVRIPARAAQHKVSKAGDRAPLPCLFQCVTWHHPRKEASLTLARR